MFFLEQIKQHILSVFIRYIPHHDSRSSVCLCLLHIDEIGFGFFIADGSAVAAWCSLLHVVIVVFGRNVVHHGEDRERVGVGS